MRAKAKCVTCLLPKNSSLFFFQPKRSNDEVTASHFAGKLSGPKNGGGKDRVGMRVPFYHKTSVELSGGRVNKLFVRERGEKDPRKQGRWWMEERRYCLHHRLSVQTFVLLFDLFSVNREGKLFEHSW